MKEKSIFIFEAETGMILSQDVVLPDGHLILPAGTTLTYESIQRISNFHILEILVEAEPRIYNGNQSSSYLAKVKQSESFKKFSNEYMENVKTVKSTLTDIATNSRPVDKLTLLKGTNGLLTNSKNNLRIFDMLHCMREFDDLTFIHSINVAIISSILGQWLNCTMEEIEVLTMCGLLHDIGKILIPDEILKKPAKLTSNEFDVIKTHVSLGYNKLKDQNIDTRVKEACLLHHERCDGSGYPFGLSSSRIPFVAKVIAIADVYDAMTSTRVYRDSMCPFEVIRIMEADAFSQFDPKYLLPFLNHIISTYLHNDVKLSNGLVGQVIMINKNELSRPSVKCGNEFIDLSRHRDLKIEAVL